jgi:hypothetical protein
MKKKLILKEISEEEYKNYEKKRENIEKAKDIGKAGLEATINILDSLEEAVSEISKSLG